MKKVWRVLSDTHNVDDLLGDILKIRGVKDTSEFLVPKHPLLYLKDLGTDLKKSMIVAKNLIFSAIEEGTPIVIHGDYDADGICATAILYNCIKKELKYELCYPFIPSRFEHGYGLSSESIKEALGGISHKGKVLFITVDSGITSVEEVAYLRSLGHEILITDHHQKPELVPDANAIVWHDKAVGASVAWLLARILGSKDASSVGLAALATVTDVQPLLGFNRSIVKMGMKVLNEEPPVGLKKLLDASGVFADKELTTYELGWVIGPRINASGRMESAYDSLKLLISQDETEVTEVAAKLNKINIDRQEKTAEMYAVADGVKTSGKRFLLSESEKYHEGIIGLVAGRLVKEYYLPSIVIALNDGVGKGSVRSISGIDIIATLRNFSHLFLDLGGHPMAAGFTIEKDKIKELKKALDIYFAKKYADPSLYVPELSIDLKISLDTVGEKLLKDIEDLKPFGIGNEEPVFLSEKVGLADKRSVGKENAHTSMRLLYKNMFYKGILFNAENTLDGISIGDRVDVVYSVRRSNYSGEAELVLKDLKISV
ncbi:MAG: single-stranded-DNA-specific exonuclease RecJ [Patescibacteria group bacterium]|jgi:single-stranded-DNA-specific exonuclease